MNILILGGTGAMGSYLAPILAREGNKVFVTTRTERNSEDIISVIYRAMPMTCHSCVKY